MGLVGAVLDCDVSDNALLFMLEFSYVFFTASTMISKADENAIINFILCAI